MKYKFEPGEFELGQKISLVKVEEADTFPLPSDGSLLRVKKGYKVYWMQNGERRWIETGDIFDKMAIDLGFSRDDIRIIKLWELKTIEEGNVISRWPESGLDPETKVEKFLLGYLPQPTYNMRLPEAKELGFDVVHSHKWEIPFLEQQLDLCRQLGLKYIVQMRDGEAMPREIDIERRVKPFKNHPALWGYYTIDDAFWRGASYMTKERQLTIYNWVKKYDSNHPSAIGGANYQWENNFEPRAFDVLFYQMYPYIDSTLDPDAWLQYMCNRLGDYNLKGKRVIPVIQSFGPRGRWKAAHVEHDYNAIKDNLGMKSSA